MENNYFSYHQKYSTCSFWCFSKISLSNFDDDGNHLLDETQKQLYQANCQFCKKNFYLKFDEMDSKDTIFYLKRRLNVTKQQVI